MPSKIFAREMDSVFRGRQWFKLAALVIPYLSIFTYTLLRLFDGIPCGYDSSTFGALDRAFWTYGVYLAWFPVVSIYFLCIDASTLEDARCDEGLYPHVFNSSVVECQAVVVYTILCWGRMLRFAGGAAPLKEGDECECECECEKAMDTSVLVFGFVL